MDCEKKPCSKQISTVFLYIITNSLEQRWLLIFFQYELDIDFHNSYEHLKQFSAPYCVTVASPFIAVTSKYVKLPYHSF